MTRQRRINVIKARAIEEIRFYVTPVVCGVRPAFLVDNISLEDDELETLVKSLQEENCEIFALRLADQIFIVHRKLIHQLLTRFAGGEYRPVFIDFPSFSHACPSALISIQDTSKAIREMLEEMKSQDIITVTTDLVSLPTIAGLLLSYPVVYYSDDPNAKLVNAEIGVFSVYANGQKCIVLMQFSCPCHFLDVATEKLTTITKEWEDRVGRLPSPLREKWCNFIGGESCILEIKVETRRVPVMSL